MRQQAARREGEREKGGARLSWSAASRLCGPCVPAWRKQARQRKGTHTLMSTHRLYTTIPKGDTFIERKNTLYTHLYDIVHSLKSAHAQRHTHAVWLVCGFQTSSLCTSLLALKCFDSEQGRTNPSEMFFCCSSGPTNGGLAFLIFIFFHDLLSASLSHSLFFCLPLCLSLPLNDFVFCVAEPWHLFKELHKTFN